MIVEQQRLNGFHYLLDLECVPHPPAKPRPHAQWTEMGMCRGPVKVQGWLLHIPGICEPEFFTKEERANARHAYLTSLMKARSYMGVVDGTLFDFRPAIPRALRYCYEHLCSDIRTGRQLAVTLRAIDKLPLKEHAYLTTAVGRALCPACVRQEMYAVVSAMRNHNDFEYWVTGWSVNYEEVGNHLTCDHCHREIPTVPQ
jgi:hypothetical protein